MEERDVPHERDGARGANLRGLAGLGGQRHADGLGHRAVDASGAARRVGLHAVERKAHEAGVAHRIRGAEDERVTHGKRIRHGGRDVQAGKSIVLIF